MAGQGRGSCLELVRYGWLTGCHMDPSSQWPSSGIAELVKDLMPESLDALVVVLGLMVCVSAKVRRGPPRQNLEGIVACFGGCAEFLTSPTRLGFLQGSRPGLPLHRLGFISFNKHPLSARGPTYCKDGRGIMER